MREADVVRLFAAVQVDPTPLLRAMLRDLEGSHPGLLVHSPSQLHITTNFIGDVPTIMLDPIKDAVERGAQDCEPLDLDIVGLRAFGPENDLRVVWAALEPTAGLVGLAGSIAEELAAVGAQTDDRPYNPHLTLARVPSGYTELDALKRLLETDAARPLGSIAVGAVHLYQSDFDEVSRGEPTYTVLHTAPLAAGS